jgi:glycosyltransferase involved in cell wall biosynthesis
MGNIARKVHFLTILSVKRTHPVPNSLSVLLPVKNAQATLAATVQEILDVAADLSEQFELLIIDDGSADATSEIATELTRSYPQVRAVCQGRSIGRQAAIHFGLKQTRGEMVLLHEEKGGSPMEEIVRLWRAASPKGRFFLPPQAGHGIGKAGSSANSSKKRGFRIIDRRTSEQSPVPSRPIMPNYLTKLQDFAFGE